MKERHAQDLRTWCRIYKESAVPEQQTLEMFIAATRAGASLCLNPLYKDSRYVSDDDLRRIWEAVGSDVISAE